MFTPWMAGAKSFECQPAAFEGAVFLDGFEAVGAAGWGKAAFGTEERRYSALVEADDGYK